jgi:hypothetical protein
MIIWKILLGVILAIATGVEYAHASRGLGTLYSPVMIVISLAFLIVSSWLIVSGASNNTIPFKSFKFLKVFVITFCGFLVVTIGKLSSPKELTNYVELNGVRVPLSLCIDESKSNIQNKKDRVQFCSCVADIFTSNEEILNKYKTEIRNGKLSKVLVELNKEEHAVLGDVENCINNIELIWNDKLVESLSKQFKVDALELSLADSSNVDEYCDCLLDEYQKIPLTQYLEESFIDTELNDSIIESCGKKLTDR